MYSFSPTDEQEMLLDALNRYARNDVQPAAREADESAELPRELLDKGWEMGVLQASIPEDYGGFGDHSAVTGVLAAESLAYGDLALALAVMTPNLFVLPVFLVGTEDQKQEYIPPVLEGKWKPYTAAWIEPTFDFDPQDLATTAEKEGDDFILNGVKTMVPFGDNLEAVLVYAALDGKTQAFAVPGDADGLTAGDRNQLLGLHALPLFDLKLDNVRVPAASLLGGPDGHPVEPLLASCWTALGAAAVGVAEAAFDYARDYAKEREVFGVKVAQKQAIAFMLAEMATDIEGIRLLTWEAAWMIDQGKQDAFQGAYLALHGAVDMVMTVTDCAVQILGGYGYIREYPVEMWMRNGRGFSTLTGLAMV